MCTQPKNILIVGLARNCARMISGEIYRLQEVISAQESVQFLIIESDSTDDTCSVLGEISKEINNFNYISLGNLRSKLPLRTQRIAHCRNEYLKQLHNNSIYNNIDYVVVADLDGVNSHITKDAYLSCWEREGWDVCAANQNGPYYDIWALRHSTWCPNDCWQQKKYLQEYGVQPENALYACIHSKMITINKNMTWIEVDSAFGGLAIYKRNVLEDVEYVGLTQDGIQVCEHVGFHKMIRDKGFSIFINPKLINNSVVEHSMYISAWFIYIRRIKRYLRNVFLLLSGR